MIAIARIPEPAMRRIELIIETVIFQTRWILAPFYLGLAFCLLLLLSSSSWSRFRARVKPM